MQRIGTWFLVLATLCLVAGMAMGIAMGLTRDFSLRPVHAHLNLVGWATLALFGLAYRGWPELARSPGATAHLLMSGSGAVLWPAGIWIAMEEGGIAVALAGALLAIGGAVVFLVLLLRQLSRPAPEGRAA